MSHATGLTERIRPILAEIRTVPIPTRTGHPEALDRATFITISREAGAGAWTLAQQLVDALNVGLAAQERPWTCWDKELVEKVAADHNLSQRLIESLEESSHSWMGDFLSGLSYSQRGDEAMVYGRVAATIRALAQAGRVVIVGRGGVFLTQKMPGGIHVRLVAPWAHRVKFMAEHLKVSEQEAAERVKELERNRHAFYKRYWPEETLSPETFTITLNSAAIDIGAMIEIIKILVRQPVGAVK